VFVAIRRCAIAHGTGCLPSASASPPAAAEGDQEYAQTVMPAPHN